MYYVTTRLYAIDHSHSTLSKNSVDNRKFRVLSQRFNSEYNEFPDKRAIGLQNKPRAFYEKRFRLE